MPVAGRSLRAYGFLAVTVAVAVAAVPASAPAYGSRA
jgi:hypothetical protein